MKKIDWRSLVLGIALTAAAWAWSARAQKQEAILQANDAPYIYRDDEGLLLFEATVWKGKRKVAILVPISEHYEFYTAPAIVWTFPYDVEKLLDVSDKLYKEGKDCMFEKWGPSVRGASLMPGRRD